MKPKYHLNQEHAIYLPIKKIAEHFGRHPDTIRSWVKNGTFPPPVTLPSGRPAWPDTVLHHDVGANIGGTPV
jgi:predicted DNA-binding transcriptional regulator AlpA